MMSTQSAQERPAPRRISPPLSRSLTAPTARLAQSHAHRLDVLCRRPDAERNFGSPRAWCIITVIRNIQEARRRNEVKIWIEGQDADCVELEFRLQSTFGSRRRSSSRRAAGPDAEFNRDRLGAGHVSLSETLTDEMILGLGWGNTLHGALPTLSRFDVQMRRSSRSGRHHTGQAPETDRIRVAGRPHGGGGMLSPHRSSGDCGFGGDQAHPDRALRPVRHHPPCRKTGYGGHERRLTLRPIPRPSASVSIPRRSAPRSSVRVRRRYPLPLLTIAMVHCSTIR